MVWTVLGADSREVSAVAAHSVTSVSLIDDQAGGQCSGSRLHLALIYCAVDA